MQAVACAGTCQDCSHALSHAGRAQVGLELGRKLMQPLSSLQQQRYAPSKSSGRPFWLHESHQDQVFELPPGGTLLASSDKTPIEIWSLGDSVLGIQGRPASRYLQYRYH